MQNTYIDISARQRVSLSENAKMTIISDLLDFEGDKPAFNRAVNMIFLKYCEKAEHDANASKEYLSRKPKKYEKQVPLLWNEVIEKIESNRQIFEDFYEGKAGAYIKSVIEQYAGLPYFERERVYFADNVQKIEQAIKHEELLHIKYTGHNLLFRPYILETNQRSTYNYLAGYSKLENEEGDGQINGIRILRIKAIENHCEDGKLTQYEKDCIKNAIENRGIGFLRAEPEKILVRLDTAGQELYRRILLNRPIYINREKDTFEFFCTVLQAEYYFTRFIEHAEIIEPEELRLKIQQRYKSALDVYKKSRKNQTQSISIL